MEKIVIRDFSYKYPTAGKEVLKNINLEIKAGEFYAVIGPNESGKSTLCKAIRGFIPHFYKGKYEGDVLIDGRSNLDYKIGELALKVAYVFQNPYTQLSGTAETVREELAFGLENIGLGVVDIKRKIDEIIELIDIKDLINKNPFELSGGQQQKVALASIIIMDADILIFDEPTSQLDPYSTEEIFKIISLLKEKDKTLILVEHEMEMVAKYADRVLLLNQGQKVMEGTVKDVLTKDEVLKNKTFLPLYSLLGLKMLKKNIKLENIPVTEEEAVREIKKYLKQCGVS